MSAMFWVAKALYPWTFLTKRLGWGKNRPFFFWSYLHGPIIRDQLKMQIMYEMIFGWFVSNIQIDPSDHVTIFTVC